MGALPEAGTIGHNTPQGQGRGGGDTGPLLQHWAQMCDERVPLVNNGHCIPSAPPHYSTPLPHSHPLPTCTPLPPPPSFRMHRTPWALQQMSATSSCHQTCQQQQPGSGWQQHDAAHAAGAAAVLQLMWPGFCASSWGSGFNRSSGRLTGCSALTWRSLGTAGGEGGG